MKKIICGFLAVGLFAGGCGERKVSAPPQTQIPPPTETVAEQPIPASSLGPLDSIKELDRKVEAYKTGPHVTPEDLEANKKLKQQIIRGTFDIYELCKLALDVHWNEISADQQSSFSSLMTSLLEKKAILSKEQVKGSAKPYRVVYKEEKFLNSEKSQAMVATKLFVPSEKIDLNINYKLLLSPRGWQIFDVIVDEASLVENYKFQFDTIIRKYSFQELVARMEKKLKEMD